MGIPTSGIGGEVSQNGQQSRKSVSDQTTDQLVAGDFPSTDKFEGPGKISAYDLITINRIAMILHGHPEGAIGLDIQRQKAHGTDWKQIVSRGYDSKPIKFELLLFKDMLTGTDWLLKYAEKIHDLVMPKKIDARNAVELYHPWLGLDGFSQVVITHRGVPKYLGKQMWTVSIEAEDIRAVNKDKTTRKITPAGGIVSNGNALGGSNTTPYGNQSIDPETQQSVDPAQGLVSQP